MRKKDYELIATWIKEYTHVVEVKPGVTSRRMYAGGIDALALRLKRNDPKFSEAMFWEACGVVESKEYNPGTGLAIGEYHS